MPAPRAILELVTCLDMSSLNKQLATAKTDFEHTTLQCQINTTDSQIDHLIYELYGLTIDEIKIIEKSK